MMGHRASGVEPDPPNQHGFAVGVGGPPGGINRQDKGAVVAALNTGSVKTRILDLLRQSPFGKTSAELATALGMHARRVAPRLIELRDTGRVAVCDVGRCNYWFAPEHADNARAQAAREGWKFTFGAQERKAATTVAAALAPTPMKPGSGPRITIAQAYGEGRA